MATEQELREQYELNQKKLGLTQGQIEEGLRLGQAKVGLSQQQLEQSYRLAQQQIQEQELEKQGQSSKLAQQAYISKAQSERVLPNVLSAMGVADTGYRNVRRQQIGQAYKGQQGAIQSDLQSAMANYGRQRSSQSLDYQQNMQGLDFTRQQLQSDYQQQLKSLELQRESASLDYRQALQRLQEQNAKSSGGGRSGGSGGGSNNGNLTQSQLNAQEITRALATELKAGKGDTNTAALTVKAYYDDGYLDNQDYLNSTYAVKRTADAVAQLKAKNSTVKPTTSLGSQQLKIKKALVIGAW